MLTCLSAPPEIRSDDILLVGCLRNEMLRLPAFLAHYRELGVDRFLLVDNGSGDGSRDYLLAQEDVTVFHTSQSYAESDCGIAWQNALLREYALGHWTFIVDVDELFLFPGCETAGLDRFLDYVDGQGATAVVAPMLDMYSERAIAETGYRRGESLIDACPCFDGEGYELGGENSEARGLPVRGGPRHRLFWQSHDREFPSPVLKKTPLVRWSEGCELIASTHTLKGVRWARVSGILLHFKFLQDFAENARAEAERAEHFADARQYRAYDDILNREAGLTAFHEGSVRFRDTAQLCHLGLMRVPADYVLPQDGGTMHPAGAGAGPVANDAPAERKAASAVLQPAGLENTMDRPAVAPKEMSGMHGYWKDFCVVDEKKPDLGGNLLHGDNQATTPALWQYLIDRFAPRSILDVGAGQGVALSYFHRAGVIAHGFDGLLQNVRNARHPIALHDLKRGPYRFPCDLVYCVEVVEHIEEAHLDKLLATFQNAPVVVITHALPGQRGHHHVNTQPREYWVEKMDGVGYSLSMDNDKFCAIAEAENPDSYFAKTGLVFLRRLAARR